MAIPTIVLEIENGMINVISADAEVRIIIVDSDTDGVDEDSPFYVKHLDALVYPEEPSIDPQYVNKYVKYWECCE